MQPLKHSLNTLFEKVMSEVSGVADCDPNVVTASKPEFGDYQANGVMAVAKRLETNPRQLAQKVVADIERDMPQFIAKLEVAGPGFINIQLAPDYLLACGNAVLNDPQSFVEKAANPQKVAVDYSSPNLAKEMHVGHLRGTIIGDCLVRVLEKLGHRVMRQNHVGDWGTQFGMLITHLNEAAAADNNVSAQLADLEEFYRAAKTRFDNDEAFATESRRSVVRLQSGEPEFVASWEKFIDESLKHCEAVYQKLNVTLTRDDLDAESRYNDDLPGIIAELTAKNLLTDSNGAKCVFLEQFKGKDGEPLPLIVQKSDGGYLYATTDLAAVRLRVAEQVDRSLYVVDARQSLHFQQVFAVAAAAGFADERISLEHVAYGTIMGADGRPFKTRSGGMVKLEELLDESVRRAHALVSEKNPELDESEREQIARQVGIGAVKYADLVKNRTSDYVFDWDTMLSFEGNTAPYMLYAYARIRSVLRKADSDGVKEDGVKEIGSAESAEERILLVKIAQFPEVVAAVARDCYPNQLCNYLYELAGLFMRFYEACPILKAESPERESRLALASLTAETLQQGLDLLGIATLERM